MCYEIVRTSVGRITTKSELELLLINSGFEIIATYGSYTGEPYQDDSKTLTVLARKTMKMG